MSRRLDGQSAASIQMVISMAILGSLGLVIKWVPYSSTAIAAIRGIVGTAALLLIARLMGHRIAPARLRASLRLLLLSGIALGINWIFSFAAYKFADMSIVTLCLYTYPVFLLLLSPILFGERLTASGLICIGTCMAGMLFSSGAMSQTLSKDTIYGILLSLIAAVFAAAVILIVKLLDGVDALDITVVQLGTATLLLVPYGLLTGSFASVRPDWRSALLLLAAGILQTGIAYYLQFSAVKRLKGQLTAILSYVDPLVAVVLSMLVLGERMDALQLFGAVLILGSTLVNQLLTHTTGKATAFPKEKADTSKK